LPQSTGLDVESGARTGHAHTPKRGCLGLRWTGSHWRREPLSGLTTLALLAILAAFVVTRIMKRIGLSMQRNTTFAFMFAFVVLVLMLWGQSFNN
jgi:hypothetical protein